MRIVEKFNKSVAKNPIAWVLAGLAIFGFYSNYSLGSRLTRLCDLVQPVAEMRTGAITGSLEETTKDFERLEVEDSLEGRLWRWQTREGRRVEHICAEREDDYIDEY